MSFPEAWARAAAVEGWLTEGQARLLWDAAASREGLVVEIGSFRGRSATILASAARHVVCVDPHLGSDRGPQEIAANPALGASDFEAFHANLAEAGVADRVEHVRALSGDAAVPPAIDVLFVDGAHRYGPALEDITRWGAAVVPGGRLLVHDSFSSIGVTLALLRALVFSREWRYLGRSRSLAQWERAAPLRGNALRQLASLPWFGRNVVVKVLIVARLPRVARLLGHRDGPWPY